MSDRVMVMNEGRIDQIGTPFEVYNQPATRFVASFVGTLSTLDATIDDPARGTVSAAGARLDGIRLPDGSKTGERIMLALRPEALRRQAQTGDASLTGKIAAVDFLGSVIRIRLDIGSASVSLDAFNNPSAPPPRMGETMIVHFAKDAVMALPA